MADDSRTRRLTANQAVTPAVLDLVNAAIDAMPDGERPNRFAAQCVLRHLARWSRDGEVSDALSQIAKGTSTTERQARRCLAVLEAAGVVETLSRGGGRGQSRRGSVRVLKLDWYGDGRPCGYRESESALTDVDAPVDNEELRPHARTEIAENCVRQDENCVRPERNSVRQEPNSVRMAGQHRYSSDTYPILSPSEIDATDTAKLSTGDDEARTIDSLAKKAGQLYAKGEHDRTRGVRSLGKLADWKTKDLLNDDWSRRMLAAAIRTADAYEAWSGRPIPLGSLAGFVLRGDIA